MNLKAQIAALLESLKAYALPDQARAAAEPLHTALESGELDWLVEHSVDEPPDDDRIVMTLVKYDDLTQWRLNAHKRVHGECFWIFNSFSVIAWRELPPVPRDET